MKIARFLWLGIGIIMIGWIYYLFISPKIFKATEIVIPEIIGLSEMEAIEKLEEVNLKYNIHYIDGNSLCVDSTLPKPGNIVYDSYVIDIYIKKPLPSYYQSFVGLIYEENIDLIEEYCKEHSLMYKVEYEINNFYPSGQIFYQSKGNTELIESGTELIFKIAVSDEYISMPNFVGKNIYDVIKILDEYKLNYNIIYYNAPIEIDVVLAQSILEGTTIKKGNDYIFDLYVSKGMVNTIDSIQE